MGKLHAMRSDHRTETSAETAPDAVSGLPVVAAASFQRHFERRWGHLTQPDVRALAWLIDAPDLLDPASLLWRNQIATLQPFIDSAATSATSVTSATSATTATSDWLAALQCDPAPLQAALGVRPYSRLGLYAEKLMAFYFEQQGVLFAHGLQVRASKNDTVGEFDFLLRSGAQLLHWEFATKFYLWQPNVDSPIAGAAVGAQRDTMLDAPAADGAHLNRLVGPNLADTLGVKMRKILERQLALARHPAAQCLLPQEVAAAQALVKGWLFYPDGVLQPLAGVSTMHCHGFWTTLAQFGQQGSDGDLFAVLPRMQWLAPFKAPATIDVFGRAALSDALAARFALTPAPVLVAQVLQEGAWFVEQQRAFIVPDGWVDEARRRREAGTLPI
jgi:hypothetical protein